MAWQGDGRRGMLEFMQAQRPDAASFKGRAAIVYDDFGGSAVWFSDGATWKSPVDFSLAPLLSNVALQSALDAIRQSIPHLAAAFDGTWATLGSKPTLFSGQYSDLTGKPSLFSGAYSDLSGKPSLFDGAYASLTGKPSLPQAVRAQTDTTGALTWTFPIPYAAGTTPIVELTVEDPSTATWNHQITAKSNLSVSIKLTKTNAVTVAGVSVLAIASNPQAYVHLTATSP